MERSFGLQTSERPVTQELKHSVLLGSLKMPEISEASKTVGSWQSSSSVGRLYRRATLDFLRGGELSDKCLPSKQSPNEKGHTQNCEYSVKIWISNSSTSSQFLNSKGGFALQVIVSQGSSSSSDDAFVPGLCPHWTSGAVFLGDISNPLYYYFPVSP